MLNQKLSSVFRYHPYAGFRNIRGFHNVPADQNYPVLLPSTNAFDIASPFIFNMAVMQILTEHSVKVWPLLFPSTKGKYNLIYSECVKVFFVRICRVFYGSQGQTQSLFFSM